MAKTKPIKLTPEIVAKLQESMNDLRFEGGGKKRGKGKGKGKGKRKPQEKKSSDRGAERSNS